MESNFAEIAVNYLINEPTAQPKVVEDRLFPEECLRFLDLSITIRRHSPPRFFADPRSSGGIFLHCVSRVVDRRFILQDEERERFTRLMRAYETFCQVRLVTYCVMSNHFHILVEVKPGPEGQNSPMNG